MMAVIMAIPRSAQLCLLLWKFRQSVMNLRKISTANKSVTTVSVSSMKRPLSIDMVALRRHCTTRPKMIIVTQSQ